MKRLRSLQMQLKRLVNLDPSIDVRYPVDMAHRFGLAKAMLVLVAPLFYAYAVHFLLVQLYVTAGLMVFGGLTTTAATILFRTITRGTSGVRLLFVISITVIATLVLHDIDVVWRNGRLEYIVWTFLYPPLAFYLLGEKNGMATALGVIAVMAVILLFPMPDAAQRVNVMNLKLQYAVCFLGTVASGYIFERTRRITQNQLVAKHELLLTSEKRLLETIEELTASKAMSERLALHAQQLSRAKSDFLAGVSHELRTPLNHIIGFTDLVLEGVGGTLTEVQREYLGDVASSSRHLLSLISDVLDLSKVEAGKMEIHTTPVDLRALLEHSVVMIKDAAMRQRVDVTTDFGPAPHTIVADERMIRQILYNLLSNAVKFTPEGGTVSISAFTADSGADLRSFEIVVADTGIGISQENLGRLFNPFEQLESVPGRAKEGTGLGLSLTKKLVELHGGEIQAESAGLGKGSTFRVSLPTEPPPGGPRG